MLQPTRLLPWHRPEALEELRKYFRHDMYCQLLDTRISGSQPVVLQI